MIERKAKVTVNEWITHGNDAFLLTGARQIGKTYLIRQCLKESGYPYIEFNFIEQPELVNLFAGAKDAKELLMRLSVVAKEPLEQGKTIIFLDEIQEFKDIVTRIKFLVEDGTFRYIMSGSLLGVELNDLRSAPVGYLEIYDMYPLDFKEFVRAAGLKNDVILMLEDHFKKRNPVDDFIHSKMLDLFYLYLIVGGMPEAVNNFVENELDILKFDEHIISDIKDMYIADMQKYVKNSIETVKIEKVYKSIPSQLAKENKNFKYNFIEENGRKRKYESSIDWLVASKMILIDYNTKRIEIPLKVYIDENTFKLYLSDVGILTNMSEIRFPDIILDNSFIYKGAITENYVAEELTSKEESLYYWTSKRNAEIDFVLYSQEDGIIPIEVKSGNNVKSVSLNMYINEYKPKYAIRFSTRNFGFENNIKSIPLYAVFCIK